MRRLVSVEPIFVVSDVRRAVIHVNDASALAEEWRSAGVHFLGPEDFEYGKHEGSHEDPDGNLIRFGSPLRH